MQPCDLQKPFARPPLIVRSLRPPLPDDALPGELFRGCFGRRDVGEGMFIIDHKVRFWSRKNFKQPQYDKHGGNVPNLQIAAETVRKDNNSSLFENGEGIC